MSIFDWLGLGAGATNQGPSTEESKSVQDIVGRLQNLPTERARWIAAFAMVMARAARADFEISSQEFQVMEKAVMEYGNLEPDQATLVAEMAAHRNQMLGASEEYLATREFKKISSEADREALLHCLFAVSAADDSISLVEEEEIRQTSSELGIEHAQFIAIRATYRDKREVLRGLRRSSI
jgi:uncharacterized tellurite resistance protein B-like protein